MKKKITLLALLLATTFAWAQDSAALESLLQRYENLPDSPLSFDHVMNANFSVEEQQVLLAHFKEIREIPAANRASSLPELFYVQNIRGDADSFGTINGAPPYDTFNLINANGLNTFADDFDGNDVLYALDYDSDNMTAALVSINTDTGTFAVVDAVAGLSTGHAPSGLSYNFDDGVMYALSTDGNGTQLYSMNLLTAVVTPIGTGTGTNVGIWLEIDNDGNAWMADAFSDQLYSVNLSTGVATPIGPLDININFAQDASYDHENGELFMAAYFGSGTGGIYSVNTNTGLTTFIGETDAMDAEFGGFSVPPPSLGVEDILEQKVSVYPNPMQNELNFDIHSGIEITQARLYNVLGEDMGIGYSNGFMNVSALPRGVYILIMETTEGKLSQKLVKQ
ncbi:T9SS type A sorting domain-containing protein [Aureisphaera galaxeae]|uniref:T9SS type A sorting domain-containing protein n=1 Tax=Aureisphaera galaxeae TaxID=1538023 RepID=UPI00235012BE|nr:T9SS type A sorting domain-containing protein [Aureisphaera galaxeae]MDC8006135.1 T9SS type A sorting domain-containing protein [Aureisphaera galaxeae]